VHQEQPGNLETPYETFLNLFKVQNLRLGQKMTTESTDAGNSKTLEDIRLAEKEAERIVTEANSKKPKIISDARARAAQFLKEKEVELAGQKAIAAEKQKEKITAARGKLLGESSEKLKSLRKSSEKRTDDAVNLVLDALEAEIFSL